MPLQDGAEVLFGYAVRHPATGGLSWVSSTEIEELDAVGGRARTRSGRLYELGRQIALEDIPVEGEEAWVAFELLLGHDVADPEAVPPRVVDPAADREWVAACKAARHLGVVAPRRIPREVAAFFDQYRVAYLAYRQDRSLIRHRWLQG
ncbi:hypothetical protein ACFOD4_08465 [Pseudoroseomonas globiformis]|uniref:Uncharacterized protein n=1 Tax=Teichococcus globiformis TaxID=2307229 RepID=A0ABV7G0X9_9PROT